MIRTFLLWGAAALAIASASPAAAAVVILDFHLEGTNFTQIFGSGAVQSFPTISGDYQITFDNSASFGKTSTGVTVANLNFPSPTFIAYQASTDTLTVGSNPNIGGYSFNSGEYGFYLNNASKADYSSSTMNYQYVGKKWRSRSVAVTPAPTTVPEPASWALMLAGFGLAGATLRGRTALSRRAAAL